MKKIVALIVAISMVAAGCSAPATSASGPAKDAATAKSLLQAFVDAKLPVSKTIEYTAETDENQLLGRPKQYTQKVNWGDTRVDGSDESYSAGTIEVFAKPEDAKARREYVESVTKDSPMLQTYNYTNGVYHMRLSYGLTADQAKEYEDIFNTMTK